MSEHPDNATLRQWLAIYQQQASAIHAELVASYTPEQRALMAEYTEAQRQIKLCRARLSPTERVHKHLIKWPTPPQEGI